MELPKRYDPKESEPKWQQFWQKNKVFKFDNNNHDKIPFTVDTPPPTVSGKMHIGHTFSYAQQDFIVRYQRMIGKNVFYPFGTDDNGLPTERLVEKLKKVKSTRMERSEFVKLCNETIKEIKPAFIQNWINIGMSCDFDGSYSTIDTHCQKTSQASFIDLFKKQLVYREETPITWCTTCQTAIAQAEFENVEMSSHFNDIVFKCGGNDLIIATTRPELLPACVGLFYHPKDERYQELKGKFAKVPLFDYEVPILTDETVAKDKGTGLMMACTFGDKEDVEKWHKHKLPLRIMFTPYGKTNKLAGKYADLKIKEARKIIIDDLKEANLLIRQQGITHPVNLHDKCGTEIEFMKTPQWYIKVLDKKQTLIEAADKINWYPKHMKIRYIHWVENLNWDWCISRQRHFGIPFPVWYCKKCNLTKIPSESELPLDPTITNPSTTCECGSNEFVPEKDVMDTWATSSVTPQIILNWKSKGKYNIDFSKFPTSLRPQAHDIIRTWLFYTIIKGKYNCNNIPWENIMISGHVQDPHGKKMSKSIGNVIEPETIINKYSSDALRFMAASVKLGEDLPFQEKDVLTGQKFINKLWNASKFGLMHLEDYDAAVTNKPTEIYDAWILSKLQKIIKECTETFDDYEYSKTKSEVEKFFWHRFCNDYLEIVKDRLYNPDRRGVEARKSGQLGTYITILSILKLIAPIMPHITEEIYQLYFSKKENCQSIHISSWPEFNQELINENAEMIGDLGIDIINVVRKYKSEQQMSMKEELQELILVNPEKEGKDMVGFKDMLNQIKEDLKATLKVKEIKFIGETSLESEKYNLKIGIIRG